MESSPRTTENNSEKKESRTKNKKKNAEALGLFAVETDPDQLQGKRQPERIGRVVVDSEAHTQLKVEKSSSSRGDAAKNIETMNRAKLLTMSEQIMVDGTSLRQIYETHLIGERGLRRLVAEHLKGGDLKEALRREIIERQIDFERDPLSRDRTHQSNGSTTLNDLLQQAAVAATDSQEEVAFFKARAAYEQRQQQQHRKQRRVIDIALAAIITTLVVLVASLLLTRH